MQIPVQVPAVWVNTTTAALQGMREVGYAAFLNPEQQARLERIRQARLLFDGHHQQYFLEERRSQFDFAPIRIAERIRQPYIKYNLLRLCSFKSADLLFGSEPLLHVEDKFQQQFLNDLVARSNLHQLFYAKAVDCDYEAECFLECCITDGQVYVRDVPADEIFPVGTSLPNGQYRSYERYRVGNIGTDANPINILLKEIYKTGSIERHCYQLMETGKIGNEIDLKEWPLEEGDAPLEPRTITGISRNTIVRVPNQLLRGKPVSGYDGSIELQDTLNFKETQLAVVLAKHGAPKMAFPQEAADDQGTIRANYEAMFYRDPERIAKYITWNSELQGAFTDREFAVNALLQTQEMSPILLGIKGNVGHAEAFRTVRVQAYSTVTKAARKASYWKNGIGLVLAVAMELEGKIPGMRYERGDVGVDLQDGLPIDDIDLANQIATTRSAGAMSLRRSIQLQIRDPEAQEVEIKEILAEEAAKTPDILIGGAASAGSGSDQETPDDDPAELERQAQAAQAEEEMEVAA